MGQGWGARTEDLLQETAGSVNLGREACAAAQHPRRAQASVGHSDAAGQMSPLCKTVSCPEPMGSPSALLLPRILCQDPALSVWLIHLCSCCASLFLSLFSSLPCPSPKNSILQMDSEMGLDKTLACRPRSLRVAVSLALADYLAARAEAAAAAGLAGCGD